MANIDLIQRFIKIYSSAQVAIDSNNKDTAEQKYQELLDLYNIIKNSDLDYNHKKIAYTQIQKVYNGIKGIDTRTSINRYVFAIAVFVILISFAVFAKPSFFGLTVLEEGLYGNQAPYWNSEQKNFEFQDQLTLNLNEYFADPEGDELTFLTKHQKGLKIALSGNQITVQNDGARGEIPLELIASDGKRMTKETVILTSK
ncbi:hypothetical protein JW851_00255 [Candidatus Woesearchaeota archaeon]|nr:hypothetical protein [Candidatus Woesearchaeota archaeon]